ncbi:ABC transporter substrate-binding protein [Wohlfahrtiimonas larvae]|uniref:Petrobactin ABC transporter substrate-binding protein YclQ n=1 Tax=Wohlfahrtiimonas larvae TaxID=1157986 RepID=A0ABP9MPN2_9GAMM|nr:ABC transporter substrate-binding protein [Wohlfahrtiimonas larvae]
MRKLLLATLLVGSLGNAMADPKGIVMDFGALDTIDALGGSSSVAALPKAYVPEYLEKYQSDEYKLSGDMFKLDMDLIRQENPDFIIISGRQGRSAAELQSIASVINFSAGNDDYLESVKYNILAVGKAIGKEAEAKIALEQLDTKIKAAQEKSIASKQKAIVLMHNDGKLGLINHSAYASLVHDVAGVKRADEKQYEGRVVADTKYLTEINPDIIYIVDRSAAIGAKPLDENYFKAKELSEVAAVKNADIIYLTPKLWYLSGKGLQSIDLQVQEVMAPIK